MPGWLILMPWGCAGPWHAREPKSTAGTSSSKEHLVHDGGLAEESPALLSEMDFLQGQQRDTERGCEGMAKLPPVLSERPQAASAGPAGLGRALSHPHGRDQPP